MLGRIGDDARIILADLRRMGEPAQIGRRCLLCRGQFPHEAQERRHAIGQFGGHGRFGDGHRLILTPQNREGKGPGAPCRPVLLLKQRRQRGFHRLAVAADRLAQRQTADSLIPAPPAMASR
jgi:hypothetical protein